MGEGAIPQYDFFAGLGDPKGAKRVKTPYEGHVWTRNKALLIQRYLEKFIRVTKSSYYIDAFAGYQREESKEQTWAAKLVLDIEPKFLKRFYLFEQDPGKIAALEELRAQHDTGWRLLSSRKVEVFEGDCNVEIPRYFDMHPLNKRYPVFCLLDQHTRQCTWELVRYLSRVKTKGSKVEILYFLAQGWLDRSWHLSSKQQEINDWWGGDDWQCFREMGSVERSECMESRFIGELGYKYAQAFPIMKEGQRGRTMFWLIHASDDSRANVLMAKAYQEIGLSLPDKSYEQMEADCLLEGC